MMPGAASSNLMIGTSDFATTCSRTWRVVNVAIRTLGCLLKLDGWRLHLGGSLPSEVVRKREREHMRVCDSRTV